MRNWTDYTEAQQKKLAPETQIALLRLHLRKYVGMWYASGDGPAYNMEAMFDRLIRLCRTHPYPKARRK
jgi:hypothetical protein